MGALLGLRLRDGMGWRPLQAGSWTCPYAGSSADHRSVGSGQVAESLQTNLAPCRRGRPVGGWLVGSVEKQRPDRTRTSRQAGSSAKARLSWTASSPASKLQIGGDASAAGGACRRQERICSAATRWRFSPGRARRIRSGAVQLAQRLGTWTSQEEVQPATLGWPCEWRYGWA